MKTFKCDCGFETQLVEIDGVLHYDEKKHGNGEAANCKCFNCGKVNNDLVEAEKRAKAKADADAEKARVAEERKRIADAKASAATVRKAREDELLELDLPQLKKIAKEKDVPASFWNAKETIVKAIVEAEFAE